MKKSGIWLWLLMPLLFFPAGCQAADRADGPLREPAVAGRFYPESAPALRLAVEKYMAEAIPPVAKDPVAIIVPHAGYVFSGQICADGFNQVRGRRYETVVILGTNHTNSSFRKVGIHPGRGFRTPLGEAAVDGAVVEALLAGCPDCTLDASIHAREHSVEVVLPFVQVLFPEAKIVPAVVGVDSVRGLRGGSALEVQITGYDNTRSLAKLAFTFYDKSARAVQPGQMTVDVTTAFRNYFAASQKESGGVFLLRAVFPVTGDSSGIGAVDVELTNSSGVARPARVQFP